MKFPARWFKQNLWAVFLFHQIFIFITAVSFLSVVRRITGRTIHLGRDPVGVIDGFALIILSAAVIVLTLILYRWIKGKDAPSLGIALSPRRLLELLIGLIIGFAFAILPWVNALLNETATIADRIGAHFDNYSIVRILAVAFFLLLIQGIVEEVANRAFPMRLWGHRSLAFRLIVPSIFFAAIHLADEQLSFERLFILLAAGIIQGFAYALTGNIWFTSGVHTGANYATFSISGLWHAGAIISIAGQPAFPNWLAVIVMLVLFSLTFGLLWHYKPTFIALSSDERINGREAETAAF